MQSKAQFMFMAWLLFFQMFIKFVGGMYEMTNWKHNAMNTTCRATLVTQLQKYQEKCRLLMVDCPAWTATGVAGKLSCVGEIFEPFGPKP